ncbi:hypothetical protein CR513_29608, partial [Mucuna pruriens]
MIFNLMILVLICVTTPIKGEESTNEKCTPCESGYTPSPPPPIEYLSPPPPSPKKPPSKYCPPPPSSAYLYMTGPPGNLYPVDENFSGASPSHHKSFALFLPLFVGFLACWLFRD